jgi:hypothetical protein
MSADYQNLSAFDRAINHFYITKDVVLLNAVGYATHGNPGVLQYEWTPILPYAPTTQILLLQCTATLLFSHGHATRPTMHVMANGSTRKGVELLLGVHSNSTMTHDAAFYSCPVLTLYNVTEAASVEMPASFGASFSPALPLTVGHQLYAGLCFNQNPGSGSGGFFHTAGPDILQPEYAPLIYRFTMRGFRIPDWQAVKPIDLGVELYGPMLQTVFPEVLFP